MTLSNAAVLLVATSLIGQLLGFLRVKLINANFSAFGGQSTDSFFAAFKIPDFFFFTIAAGALGVAFMPILADHLQNKDKKGVWDLSSSLLNFLAIIMLFVGLIIFIFAKLTYKLCHYYLLFQGFKCYASYFCFWHIVHIHI